MKRYEDLLIEDFAGMDVHQIAEYLERIPQPKPDKSYEYALECAKEICSGEAFKNE